MQVFARKIGHLKSPKNFKYLGKNLRISQSDLQKISTPLIYNNVL